ncbi:MAG: calcium-translocating P-type ATPase, PMCA-type, partial [Ruminococcaceae bacterium]|nr:calcium-translocating P-type ATPase, PMCA-type [Oscillospiraceae bacterium]
SPRLLKKRKSTLRIFLSNLGDPIIRILLGALALNLVLSFRGSDWIETLGIGVAVFLATLISTLSEQGSERAFSQLSAESEKILCRVRRDREIKTLPVSDVVVGDVVLLSAGEQIPADGLLLLGEVRTDQSAMTGESREVRKIPSSDATLAPGSPSALFRGCTVTSGEGEMVICAVGDASFLGGISREIQEDVRESPLKLRLSKLARQISRLGYLAAVGVALAYLFNAFFLDSGMQREVILLKFSDLRYLFEQLLHAFTLGLTVVVVAVPEGLPMMIAVVLSANIRKMVRDQVLVRKPVGIEAAGSMNILFTDKTGTLTEGKMRLDSLLLADGKTEKLPNLLRRGGRLAELTALGIRFASASVIGKDPDGTTEALGGNATDRALLHAVLPYPAPQGYRVDARLPFDSARKYASVTLGGKQRLTYLLGAPEKLLPQIQYALGENGDPISFSAKETERKIFERTRKGERVVLLALTEDAIDATRLEKSLSFPLVFLAALVLRDPLRPEAAKAVAELSDAGIHVVMVTGDSRETASYIASSCGILSPKTNLILTGTELAALSDTRLRELLPRLAVVARALPADKSRLVRISQEAGLVTGMTGDGINDAPALRRADIGFAMGNGTQVARDAGDIIILDNNLASIVRAVLYGRTIFKSIRKFITLQLTMNFCAVGVTMICPFLGIDSPVTVVQMLWINMIMDTLGGLAFAGEPAEARYMREPPKKRGEPILNRYMVNQILLLGGFTVALCLFFLKSPTVTVLFRPAANRIYLLTAFFALFIFTSVFNCFNARTDRLNLLSGLKKNPVFITIMVAILIIQIVFVYLGGSVLRTAPLLPRELILTMLLSLSVFPAELLRKCIWRLCGGRDGY